MPHWIRPLPVGVAEAGFRIRLTGAPQPFVNILGLDLSTEPSGATANSIFSIYATRIMPLISNACTLELVHLLYQSDGLHQITQDSNNATVAGGKTGGTTGTTTPQVTFLVRKRTAFAGRSQRGRMYVPGVLETDADALGVIVGTRLTEWATPLAGFLSDLSSYGPCLIHSVECTAGDAGHEGPHDATPLPVTPVTSFELDDHVATQRRRLAR